MFVDGAALGELAVLVAGDDVLDDGTTLSGVVAGAADVETSPVGGVDVAVVSTADVDVPESVDVAATCARTGLTMANPITSATMRAVAPTNVMMLVFTFRLLN